MKTYSPKAGEINRVYYLVDADGETLGRLAAKVAHILRGKHKPTFAPHIDTGDCVIVVNAKRMRITGNKRAQKFYYRHSGRPGSLKSVSLGYLMQHKPEQVLQKAVRGMLPKGALGRQTLGKLRVYAAAEHPHQAQKPIPLEV